MRQAGQVQKRALRMRAFKQKIIQCGNFLAETILFQNVHFNLVQNHQNKVKHCKYIRYILHVL